MKLKIQQVTQKLPEVLIIPILKDQLENSLQEVEEWSGVKADTLAADFDGNFKKVHSFYNVDSPSNKKIILLGLGSEPNFPNTLKAFRMIASKMKAKLPKSLGVYFSQNWTKETIFPNLLEAAVNGWVMGHYNVGLYKTSNKKSKKTVPTVSWLLDQKIDTLHRKALTRGQACAETQASILDLVNAPANHKRPKVLADWAKKSAKANSFQCKVLDKKQIEQLKMGAFLAVNRGSEDPPHFIIMEHKPKKKNVKKIGLIGKGITFDTGGLSIKGSHNMHYMKSDMGGAAAVLGAMELIAKLDLPLHVIGIVPTTDNSVDALSVKPGDVVTSYSGKTIEIIDTDAEGRLILADGIAYMNKNFSPDIMIDLATLTGSCVRTLGYQAGGLFTDNEDLAKGLLEAGENTGERLWRLPLWDAYKKGLESDVADVRNLSTKPLAGASVAAKFLETFTDEHKAWAHLDIAGVALGNTEMGKGMNATAYGVRLLVEFLENL